MARRMTAAFAALAAADTVLAAAGRDRLRWLTKPLLMPTLMVGRDVKETKAADFAGDHGEIVPAVVGPEGGDECEHESAEAAGGVGEPGGEVGP